MKTNTTPKSAFTLVEMLVVIAIISLVAMSITTAVKGAQRTANAAKCQANMKNLHTAVVAFLADKGYYPLASSYEVMGRDHVGKYFSERQGWVSWVPKSGVKRRDDEGKTLWQENAGNGNSRVSYGKKFCFPANTDSKMQHAISEGSLYKYAGKDPMTYCCPQHRVSKEGKKIYLAYSMNSWFLCHSYLHKNYGDWTRVKNGVTVDYYRRSKDFTDKKRYIPSRMALFIEMEDADKDASCLDGQSADGTQNAELFKGDCVWEWSDKVGLEKGRYDFKNRSEGHFKGGTKYCNVVFVDGHVMAVPEVAKDEDKIAEWNDHKDLNDVFKSLGEGSY